MIARMPEPSLVAAVRLLIEKTGLRASEQDVVTIVLPVGGPGAPLVVGEVGPELRVGVNAALRPITWSLSLDQSGAATIDIRDHTGASVCGGAIPTISAAQRLADQTAVAWDQLADPTWLYAHVTTADGTIEGAVVSIRARKV